MQSSTHGMVKFKAVEDEQINIHILRFLDNPLGQLTRNERFHSLFECKNLTVAVYGWVSLLSTLS